MFSNLLPELEEEELDDAEAEAEEEEDTEDAEAAPESEYAEPLNAVNLDVNQSVSYLDDEALNMEFDDAQEQFLDEVEEADYTIVSSRKTAKSAVIFVKNSGLRS